MRLIHTRTGYHIQGVNGVTLERHADKEVAEARLAKLIGDASGTIKRAAQKKIVEEAPVFELSKGRFCWHIKRNGVVVEQHGSEDIAQARFERLTRKPTKTAEAVTPSTETAPEGPAMLERYPCLAGSVGDLKAALKDGAHNSDLQGLCAAEMSDEGKQRRSAEKLIKAHSRRMKGAK